MLTVHHLNNSRSQRILWLLEELGADYEIAHYQRDAATQRAPESLKQVHPLGKSPVITDGGRTIAESGAIIDYIVRHYGKGKLAPPLASPAYDEYVEWLHFAEGSAMAPVLFDYFLSFMPGDSGMLTYLIGEEIKQQLAYIDSRLGDRPFLVGEELTGADVNLAFVLEFAGSRGKLDTWPRLRAYVERLQARPAYKRAIEKGGEYALGGFGNK